jgi:hypothetical protein
MRNKCLIFHNLSNKFSAIEGFFNLKLKEVRKGIKLFKNSNMLFVKLVFVPT